MFDAWSFANAICPDMDIKYNERFELKGDPGTMISDKMVFQVRKCNPEIDKDCASPEEIDKFVQDLTIETWSITEKINFEEYQKKPTYHKMELVSQQILQP